MSRTRTERNWNPVTYQKWGEARYCSTACGHGCTRDAYDKAVKLSKALCKRLGAGWTPNVWENLGWHFSAKKGKLEVHRNAPRRYWANFNATVRQFETHDETPQGAVAKVIKMAEDAARSIVDEVADIRQ